MQGKSKKQRRAIGKLVRKIRKLRKKGYDYFVYDRFFKRVVATKSSEVARIGKLEPVPFIIKHDLPTAAFSTMLHEQGAFVGAMPIVNDASQIYTLNND